MHTLPAAWIWVALAQAPAAPAAEIPKYMAVNPKLGTGGQPSPQGLERLKEQGYTAVINLRTGNEGVDLAAEEKRVLDLGLQYFNIPVVSADPKEAQAIEFLKLLEELKNEKVFVHCAAANRVGGFLMIQWAVKEGMPPEEAEALANRVGLQSEKMRQFARGIVESRKRK